MEEPRIGINSGYKMSRPNLWVKLLFIHCVTTLLTSAFILREEKDKHVLDFCVEKVQRDILQLHSDAIVIEKAGRRYKFRMKRWIERHDKKMDRLLTKQTSNSW